MCGYILRFLAYCFSGFVNYCFPEIYFDNQTFHLGTMADVNLKVNKKKNMIN